MPGIRPFLKFSYALNWTVHSGPFGFHLFNVLVHVVNTILVYRLLRTLAEGQVELQWAPLIGALLFALHPVQTEAVTYISGRSVSLMALFYLCSVLAWLRADRFREPSGVENAFGRAVRRSAAGEGNGSHAAVCATVAGWHPAPVRAGADAATSVMALAGADRRFVRHRCQPHLPALVRSKPFRAEVRSTT